MSPSAQAIDLIRASSRQLVRELGFTSGDFAGTDLSPSAVHALIEIERGGITARDLGVALHLEKSSVSRMLRKLIKAGEVFEEAGHTDGRVKQLSLTPAGLRRVAGIHEFARAQVASALQHLAPEQVQTVLEGLRLYGGALAGRLAAPSVEICTGYRSGVLARVVEMHALHYARTSNFGQAFESVVAGGLAEFGNRMSRPINEIWTAMNGDRIIGSVAIDGEDLGAGIAHLRWFIVDDTVRGGGVGKQLLDAALAFVDERGFVETHLWTFSGLHAARHLYEKRGFVLTEERHGSQWGSEVLEQRFVRALP